MREIKFRAWDTELKMMVYENEQTGDIGYETNPVHAVNSIINEDYVEYIWMQYTGLKDKDGKEIYEGDIVEIISQVTMRYEKGKIIFDCGCYFVNYGWNTHLLFEFLNDIKVVGNIYENPELLEEINNGKR